MKFPSLNKVKTSEENIATEVELVPIPQEELQTDKPIDTVLTNQDDSARFEDNRKYIVKALAAAGLPLVLRSEQNIPLQEETKQEILTLLEETSKLKESLLRNGKNVEEEEEYLLRSANFYHVIGNSQKAIEMYEYILKKNPTKMASLNNKGVVLDADGQYDAALQCYNHALNKVPENVHVLSNKGITLYKNEKYEQALECFDAALKIDASYISALTFKGHSLYRLGQKKDALEWYNKVIRLDNTNAEALYNKACLCTMKGDEYGAITSLEKAIRLDPSWKEAAKQDKDLEGLRSNLRFREIVR
ncbi:MAG TPA: tetratricopeptide repeat protein [Candidatus Nitrosotalea sp.]|nr:tetratricopeptide repeat protein [Candidatus Nitrosotalea sp.]